MFATATRNFVEEVDNGGLLIPLSSLNDTIALLTVVVKRKRFWVWQKPKYIPSDFNLNDILTGDIPIKPGVIETDFIKYNGTFGDNIQGTVDANFVHTNVSLEGKDSSKLQSSFGSLKKEEVDVQKLLRDSKGRVLDMSHSLIQQTKEKPRQVFGFVKERIVTTQPCSVIEEVQQGGQCGGGLSLCGPKSSKVQYSIKLILMVVNITMEIPIHTTIAYALLELEIKQDGRFGEECVSGKGELHLSSAGLAALTEDVFEKTEHLFASSNVSLKRDGDTVKTEISHLAGNRPLVLCIAVRGLASLAHSD
uniref:Gasdermin Eb n=1 Tax=Sander lucioperca TaxID=283035 RepID=A0A8C9XJA8_SANLU